MYKKGNFGLLKKKKIILPNFKWPNDSKFGVSLSHDVDRTKKTYQYYTKLVKGNFNQFSDIFRHKEPYWQFDNIVKIESKYGVRSTFFFLDESLKFNFFSPSSWKFSVGRYNINSKELVEQIRYLDKNGWEIGLHGSILSYSDEELLSSEKKNLEKILDKKILGIRQHYLNLDIPNSWQIHKKVGFEYDASFGYNDRVGFKENITRPFFPYKNSVLVLPLALMDGNLFGKYKTFDDQWSKCLEIISQAERTNSLLSVLWHQRVFYEKDFPNYTKIYEKIIQECLKRDAWFGTSEQIYKHIVRSDKS